MLKGILFGLCWLTFAGIAVAQVPPPTAPLHSKRGQQAAKGTLPIAPPPSRPKASTNGAAPPVVTQKVHATKDARPSSASSPSDSLTMTKSTVTHSTPRRHAQRPAATEPHRFLRQVKPPPRVLHIKPGVNVLFGVAENELNRLVTPFANPVIETTSGAVTYVRKNVVYVAPHGLQPVGFFIHNKGDQADAISITMVPAQLPPVSVTLELEGYTSTAGKASSVSTIEGNLSQARSWENQSPFTDTIRNLFTGLAKGEVPNGYSFSSLKGRHSSLMPRCQMPGLTIVPRQLMTGYAIDAIVALVTNTSHSTRHIMENACKNAKVLAIAAWPRVNLLPGEKTKLYIAVRAPNPDAVEDKLPPLLTKEGE